MFHQDKPNKMDKSRKVIGLTVGSEVVGTVKKISAEKISGVIDILTRMEDRLDIDMARMEKSIKVPSR